MSETNSATHALRPKLPSKASGGLVLRTEANEHRLTVPVREVKTKTLGRRQARREPCSRCGPGPRTGPGPRAGRAGPGPRGQAAGVPARARAASSEAAGCRNHSERVRMRARCRSCTYTTHHVHVAAGPRPHASHTLRTRAHRLLNAQISPTTQLALPTL
ncbi:unnamed protein product [Chrysodeixis includens]|uniref:Uncharacterized protein n=1 Tax=Chrysodeixis includens TaxID=689277 RepID=A0A9N8KZV1_CHRIL|nr:unnamed protein product [Chrysodeixis includens]